VFCAFLCTQTVYGAALYRFNEKSVPRNVQMLLIKLEVPQ